MKMHLDDSIAEIPAHNEAAPIEAIVTAARVYVPIIVVDDASNDGSGQRAVAAGATVLTLSQQRGKGIALRYGFAEALRRGAEFIVTLDGDGQHNPHDIPRLVAASRRWPESIIIGGRLQAEAAIPRHRLHAIRVASFWINWMGGCHIQDTQSGFRVYPAAVLRSISLKHGGFLLESECLLKACQAGYAVREVPIRADYQSEQRSQYRPVRDGTIAAAYLLYRGIRFWPIQIRRLFRGRWMEHDGTSENIWQHTIVVVLATGLLPVLFLAMMLQLLIGHVGFDVLAPLIRRFYNQRILHAPVSVRKTLYGRCQHKKWKCI